MLEPLPDGLRIVRTVPGRREEVFDAWVDRDRLRAWWGPPGVAVTALEGELRVGGVYTIAMRQADGAERVLVWTFRAIEPPARLVFEWGWADGSHEGPDSLVTVVFRAAGAQTELELTHTGIADRAVRESHGAGWLGCCDALAAYVT